MVIAGACLYEDREMKTRDSRVAFSSDGKEWTPLATMQFKADGEHLTDGHWMWRVSWHEDRAYGVSKLLNPHRAILFTSKDGVHWRQVTRFAIPDDYHQGREGKHPTMPTEITVRVLRDNSMLALVRQAWIGTSQPPYTDWNRHKVRHAKDHPPGTPHVCTIGSPNFVEVGGSLWGSGRRYHRPEGLKFKKTVLAAMTRDHYEPVLELPSGGDTSYAGIVWHDGLLWMSYYSSHEERPSIYLAKIRLDAATTALRSPPLPQSQSSWRLTVGDVKLLSADGSTRATRYANANKIVTFDATTHVAWLDSGSRTMIATRDRTTGNWSRPVHLGSGVDNHGGPALTCDSQGHLHLLFGPHAESQFRHFRSAKPNDTSQWIKLERFGSYPTYPSLVCDHDDTLHIVYRGGPQPRHPFQLLYQRKPKGGGWSDPIALATCLSNWNDYTAYHASLSIARDNSLHLAYDIYYNGSALVAGHLMSDDAGSSWRLADGRELDLPVSPSTDVFFATSDQPLKVKNIVCDSKNRPWFCLATAESSCGLMIHHHDGKQWRSFDPASRLDRPEMKPNGGIGTITMDTRDRLYLAGLRGSSVRGGVRGEVVLLCSDDRGERFRSLPLFPPDSTLPHAGVTLERPTGHNGVDTPLVLFSTGEKGASNQDNNEKHLVRVVELQNRQDGHQK